MLIPSKLANLIKEAETELFYNPIVSENKRIYYFWKLIRPLLSWFEKGIIQTYELEPAEAESYIYLFAAKLFKNFNPQKSSIIPYLQKQIPWQAKDFCLTLTKKYNKFYSFPGNEIVNSYQNDSYNSIEEFYWATPKILFEEKFIGKVFTKSQKYIISKILSTDDNSLSQVNLAKKLNLSKDMLVSHLKVIKSTMEVL